MLVRVTWRVVSSNRSIRCRRYCSRCGGAAIFTSSGRFRVNTNGKRVDAWLVYTCDGCGRSWNLEILERAPVRTLAPATYQQLLQNDGGLARRYALDADRLRRRGAQPEPVDFEVHPSLTGDETPRATTSMEITMLLPEALTIRLDRVLAVGLGRSRREIRQLGEQGGIDVVGADNRRALDRPVVNGQRVLIHGLGS
jgi:hypothetical protein